MQRRDQNQAYCIKEDCKKSHCLWGEDGNKRKHKADCILKHCYDCSSHKIQYDRKGFVKSWYCKNCQKSRNKGYTNPQEGRILTITEIQKKLKELAKKAPKNTKKTEFQLAEGVFL